MLPEEKPVLFTKCILDDSSPRDGLRISVMSRHTLKDGVTPDTRITRKFDIHVPTLGPSSKLIGSYYRQELTWSEFEQTYRKEIQTDEKICSVKLLAHFALVQNITLMCIEEDPDHCHRRLLMEECRRLEPRLCVGRR